MNILHELYIGNVSPHDMRTVKTEEYRELTKEFFAIEERLKAELNKEQWKLHEKSCELMLLREAITQEQLFTYGFKLGVKIMLEVINADDKKDTPS